MFYLFLFVKLNKIKTKKGKAFVIADFVAAF